MGIQNLLKELRPITKNVSLEQFSGQKCGVDASCWLHRASHSCALQLVANKPTTKYLDFTLKCIKTLLYYKITPIIVFDGAHLPMKANEEERRNKIRKSKKKEALQHMKSGNREEAWKAAQAAVRITKQMVTGFINQCIKHDIKFVCAPYEADSQLGYMYKTKHIDFVITEDSDLFLFGVEKALYKLNLDKNCGDLVNLNEIKNYKINRNMSDKKKKTDLCLFLKKFWKQNPKNIKEFIYVCVLSGCDYVKNLPGIGIKTAVKYCTENRKIEYLLRTLTTDKFDQAPKDYRIQFKRAVLTFLHQRVYDINSNKLVHLNPLTDAVDDYLQRLNKYLSRGKDRIEDRNGKNPTVYDTTLDFLGKAVDDNMAKEIAEGRVDARSLQPRNLVASGGNEMEVCGTVDEIENCNGNRFFASSNSNVATVANTSGFGMTQGKLDWKKKKGSYGVKGKKYFGALDNGNVMDEMECDDGLGEWMMQFGYKENDNEMDNMRWGNTEDTEVNEKENESNIIVEDSDIDVPEVEIERNKPLRRQNRKRKRNVMDEIPVQNVQKNSRRRLNNGNVRNMNGNNTNNKMITPRNTFRKMANNVMETPVNNDSIISDLFSTNSKKKYRNSNRNRKENVSRSNKKNKTPHNPFSLKKKKRNNGSNRKAIAMIGNNKPINISDSESESESYNYINNTNINMNTNNNGNNFNYDFEENINDSNSREYSQLSQSQSEKQVDDMMKDFQLSQSQSQRSDETKEEHDNEDDDIQIISVKKEVKSKGFTPPKFKKPKFTNLPIKNNSSKKKKVVKKNNNSKKKSNVNSKYKPKIKGKNNKKKKEIDSKQKTLYSFFKMKTK